MEIRFENEMYDLSLNGHRKILHNVVEDAFSNLCDVEYDDLDMIHSLISSQDVQGLVNGFFCNGDLTFMQADYSDYLVDALTNSGYSFEKSNVSRSLYATNDNGKEVRISDHVRPAIVQNGVYVGEHDYSYQIIVKDNIVSINKLKENGFSKLNKSEYILG